MTPILLTFALAALLGGGQQTSAPATADRNRAMVQYRIGFDHMQAEALEEAAKSFQSAADLDRTFEMAYYMLGRVRMDQRRYTEAAAAYLKAQQLYVAQDGQAFTSLLEVQRYRRDQIIEIEQTVNQLETRQQTAQVIVHVRQLNERKRQLQDAIRRGDNHIAGASVPAYLSLSLGSAYFRMGRMGDAETAFREAVGSDPKCGEAHNNLAIVYLETSRFAEAEKSVKAAEKAGFRVQPELKEEIKKKANAKKS